MPRHSEATKSAIKDRNDIVALVGEYLSLRRVGNKYKALCPWHDDHNPSLELNPDRQSFKCWVCGVGGDVFDFVKRIERVEFPEALRMLAERAGVALESPKIAGCGTARADRRPSSTRSTPGPRRFLLASFRLRRAFRITLTRGGYRGRVSSAFVWAMLRSSAAGCWRRRGGSDSAVDMLVEAGLASHPADPSGSVHERFRGRLIFPIHDDRARAMGFGGRILPDVAKKSWPARARASPSILTVPRRFCFTNERCYTRRTWLERPAARRGGSPWLRATPTSLLHTRSGSRTSWARWGRRWVKIISRRCERLADRVVLVYDADAGGARQRLIAPSSSSWEATWI